MRGGAVMGRGAVLGRGLAAAIAVAAVAAGASRASAHLPVGERSLVALLASSRAMVLARSLDATAAPGAGGESQTRFAVLEPLAGPEVAAEIAVVGAPPHLRYPANETAIVLLAAAPLADGAWPSPQRAGMRLSLPEAPLSPRTARALRELWAATHAAPPTASSTAPTAVASSTASAAAIAASGAPAHDTDARLATAALASLASAPEARLRALAAFDLAQLAILHPEDFAPETRERIAAAAAAATDDTAARAALELATRRLDDAAARPLPPAGRPS